MARAYKLLHSFCVLLIVQSIYAYRFSRTIEAVGYPYYKIIFSLGECKDRIIFTDNKVWGSVRLNRIFDIFYRTSDDTTISRVEIKLVVNNTDCITASDSGVGGTTFSAVMALPTNVGIIFYSLNIFTCSPIKEAKPAEEEETVEGYLDSSEID